VEWVVLNSITTITIRTEVRKEGMKSATMNTVMSNTIITTNPVHLQTHQMMFARIMSTPASQVTTHHLHR